MKKSKLPIALLILVFLMAVVFTGCGEKEETPALSCTVTVTAADILKNKDLVDETTLTYVPDDGIIFSDTVNFDEGDSLFDVLCGALKDKKLQYEAQSGSYFTAFGNIYATASPSGGWLYHVNDVEPSVGANEYMLKNGDKVEFFYICDCNAYFAEIYG